MREKGKKRELSVLFEDDPRRVSLVSPPSQLVREHDIERFVNVVRGRERYDGRMEGCRRGRSERREEENRSSFPRGGARLAEPEQRGTELPKRTGEEPEGRRD